MAAAGRALSTASDEGAGDRPVGGPRREVSGNLPPLQTAVKRQTTVQGRPTLPVGRESQGNRPSPNALLSRPTGSLGDSLGRKGKAKGGRDSPRSREGGQKLLEILQEAPLNVDKAERLLTGGRVWPNFQEESFGWSPLLFVASSGHQRLASLVLEADADLDARCNLGNTALHTAARGGHLAVVELLLDRGAKVDAQNSNDWTPLAWGAMAGREDVVLALLDAAAGMHWRDSRGRTPCMWAARHGHLGVVRVFLERGLDLRPVDDEGLSVLDHAEEHEDTQAMLAAAQQAEQALLDAARRDDVAAARFALEAAPGGQASLARGPGDRADGTPLEWAVINGSADMARLLVGHGAELEAESAALVAGGQVADEVAKVLHANSSLPSCARSQDWDGAMAAVGDGAWVDAFEQGTKRTALHWASIHGCAPAALRLANAGAGLEVRDADGWTAVHCALQSGHEEVVSALHFLGASLSARASRGDTLCHLAARADSGTMVQLLHAARCGLSSANAEGLAPLQVAAEGGCASAVCALIAFQADAGAKDGQERTALAVAAVAGSAEVVQVLLAPFPWPGQMWDGEDLAEAAASLPAVEVPVPQLVQPEPEAYDGEQRDDKGPAVVKKATKGKKGPKGKKTLKPTISSKGQLEELELSPARLSSLLDVSPANSPGAQDEAPRRSSSKEKIEERLSREKIEERPSKDSVEEVVISVEAPAGTTSHSGGALAAAMPEVPEDAEEADPTFPEDCDLLDLPSEATQSPTPSARSGRMASPGRQRRRLGSRRGSLGATARASLGVDSEEAALSGRAPSRSPREDLGSTPLALLWWAAQDRDNVPEGRTVAAFPNAAAAVSALDSDGRNVLALAVVHRKPHLVPLLLARQAQVDAVDAERNTALMLGAQVGDPLAVQYLLAAGASATLRNKDGKSAADLAGHRGTQLQIQWCCDTQKIGSKLANSPSLPSLSEAEAAAERSRRFRLRVECLPKGAESDVLEDNIRLMLEKRGTPPMYLTVGVDPITQLSRGHVYLDYAERSKARSAANLDGRLVLGCTVRVIEEGPVFV